jgi:hypothetical protein
MNAGERSRDEVTATLMTTLAVGHGAKCMSGCWCDDYAVEGEGEEEEEDEDATMRSLFAAAVLLSPPPGPATDNRCECRVDA